MFRVRKLSGPPCLTFWAWECTLCDPPARGGRFGRYAWHRVITISLPHHMRVRLYHHQHVKTRR